MEHISVSEYEILDPIDPDHRTFGQKYGPYIFWGTMVAMPILNLTASALDYRTAKINLELEKLKEAAELAQ